MTQSGVSQHIRKLEEQLDQVLLNRHGKQFTLTEAGERLYREGGEILRSLDELEKSIGDDPEFEGVVRVASPGSLGLKLYPHLLTLQQRYPELIIDYRFAPNNDIEKLIADAKVDIGFMTRESKLDEVSVSPIAEEALLLVTPFDVEVPSWDNLMDLGFIEHPDGVHHATALLAANYPEFQHCNQFKRTGFSNHIGLILEPVSLGFGFTVLPIHAVEASKNKDKIRIHSLANPVCETLYLGQHINRFVSSRVNSVINHSKACLE